MSDSRTIAFVGACFAVAPLHAASVDFNPSRYLAGPILNGAITADVTDLDQDGHLDILAGAETDERIVWLKNRGDATFELQVAATADPGGTRKLMSVDIDLDGKPDLLAASFSGDVVSWYRHLGDGEFAESEMIAMVDGPSDFSVGDLNQDGYPDLLVASYNGNSITWHPGGESGQFAAAQMLNNNADKAVSVSIHDLDGDGDLDVLSASSGDGQLIWYRNTGMGNFAPGHQIDLLTQPALILASDMDGDGDVDVLSSSSRDRIIAWYENDGEGNFNTQHVIDDNAFSVVSIDVSDLDADGDQDLLVAKLGDNRVVQYENDGAGAFGAGQVLANITQPNWVLARDLDKDGYVDAIWSERAVNGIYWQQAGESGVFQARRRLNNTVPGVTSLFGADMDGDGDADILSASSDPSAQRKISYFENLGAGFGTESVITTEQFEPTMVLAEDLDADGDADVLSADFGRGIGWFTNLGSGGFGPRQVIGEESSKVRSIFTDDLDGDGDSDVLATTIEADTIAWYANDAQGGFGSRQLVTDSLNAPTVAISADIDGDGDQDVIAASSGSSDEIAWYRNQSAGTFDIKQTIFKSQLNEAADSLLAADFDSDGDVDIAAGFYFRDLIAWYANDGDGNFSAPQIISNTIKAPRSIKLADIDDDGHIDIISVSAQDDQAVWYENDGAGVFGSSQLIGTTGSAPRDLIAIDADGDLAADIFVATYLDAAVEWKRNGLQRDFGDAPDPLYPTLRSNNGPRHELSSLFLGNGVDAEPNGQPDDNALGDDRDAAINDEQGVEFYGLVIGAGIAELRVVVSEPGAGLINAFLDFDADGGFDGLGEHIVIDEFIEDQAEVIGFEIPESAVAGPNIARVRVNSDGGVGAVGQANDGEVEDYSITLTQAPELSVADASAAEGDTGQQSLVFSISLSEAVEHDVSVTFRTTDGSATQADSDYVANTGRLTIPGGLGLSETTAVVSILGDGIFEENQTLTLELSEPLGAVIADGQAIGTIINDEAPPQVHLEASRTTFSEDQGYAMIDAVLSHISDQAVSVDLGLSGQATGADYQINSSQINVASRSLRGSVRLSGVYDSLAEGDESVVVAIASVVNASVGTPDRVSLVIQDTSATEQPRGGGGGSAGSLLYFALLLSVMRLIRFRNLEHSYFRRPQCMAARSTQAEVRRR